MQPLPSLDIIGQGHKWSLINKPAGIAVERHGNTDTVELRAVRQFRRSRATKDPYIGIVHRLDKPTSGCLLVAHNKSTLVGFHRQWEARSVRKLYWALVGRPPSRKTGRLIHYIQKDRSGRKAIASPRPIGKTQKAELEYRILRSEVDFTLLEIELFTGRFHQVRAQLSAISCPIIGDRMYGSETLFQEDVIALHARSLSFDAYIENPDTGGEQKNLSFQAPLPAYWPINDD
ncbi:MAG: RNA pseudouridine synthase [Bacteroidota bacterium]